MTVTTPPNPSVFDHEIGRLLLEDREVRLVLEEGPNRLPVEQPIGLCAGRSDRRTFARVEGPKLDAGSVDGARHPAPEGIDFANEVTLADTPESGVATHLSEGLDALGQQQGTTTHPRRGERGLGAGMTAPDDDDFECLCVTHGWRDSM